VNVPKAREIAVVDRFVSKQTASWPIDSGSNFPMALDESSGRLFVERHQFPDGFALSGCFRRPGECTELSLDMGPVNRPRS
jgi:hypothetical protein